MHIPDGFLNTKTWVFFDLLSAAFIVLSLERVRNKIEERQIPIMGVTASFIFAAQLLNFPILPGASGHLIGGALSAILLGPWASIIVMATVLVIQSFLFQDGGLTALGTNIFNMGVLSAIIGFPIFIIIKKIIRGKFGIFLGAFLSAWISVVLASVACSFQLGVSGIVPLNVLLPAMVFVHSIIGIGEGFITYIVVKLVIEARPDLVSFLNLKNE